MRKSYVNVNLLGWFSANCVFMNFQKQCHLETFQCLDITQEHSKNERKPSGDSRKAVYFIVARSLDRAIFVYTFHMMDWIEWHPVFHNYDFLNFPRTIKG